MRLKPEDHGWTKQGPSWYTKLFKPNILCGIVKDESDWFGRSPRWVMRANDKEFNFRTLSEAIKFTNVAYMFVRWDIK